MIRFKTLLLAALIVLNGALPALGAAAVPDEARLTAEAWLRLVDGGEYDRCWDQASPLLRENMQRDVWSRALTQGAAQLGPLAVRKLENSQLDSNPPQRPEGEYALFRFGSIFRNATVRETLALRMENGAWRVVAYWLE